ncbi:MAG TPA: hypothetical protein PK978_00125 [Paludibacter sp.]|jgi:hypothetical protein|nr:MAG: hypothetical protein BWY08_01657 [Bacteroidetes bacterium ADurb.Bin174]HOG04630.1 hypothetical protein [Paludibacter sp.]HPM11073.1 hypothetical protein [Paludibacter sp.]
MKNIELLPIPEENKKRISQMAAMYRRNARIFIDIVSFKDNRLIVRVEQKELVNGLKLSKKELTTRVREMLAGEIPASWKLTVSAVDYDRKDIDAITAEWLKRKMENLNLKSRTVSAYTGIDKSTLSSLLSGDKNLTKWHKVAFYYFFKYQEAVKF